MCCSGSLGFFNMVWLPFDFFTLQQLGVSQLVCELLAGSTFFVLYKKKNFHYTTYIEATD